MLEVARTHRSWRRIAAGTFGVLGALALMAASSPAARADDCPPIADKPDQKPHVDYTGIQHLTYCVGPVTVKPGQNIIRLNSTNLFPQVPGYITRFDPELVYADGTVPKVDVVHLHHAVWLVNGGPEFATGEEKTILQMPQGFGWRSVPSDHWALNDMLHDLVGRESVVYIVWRIDFLPDTALGDQTMHTVRTQWMDVSGPNQRVGISSPIYPVFNSLKGYGANGKYTFPDQASTADKALIGNSQTWTPNHGVTLISTAGHLHPGGLSTTLSDTRGGDSTDLFTSEAHYYEPAGAVSWDVSMGSTPTDWRVKVQAGDTVAVHATYDTKHSSWYEVMGIMPVAVYNGTDVGGVDAFDPSLDKQGVLTHTHLEENRHHGGAHTRKYANALDLPSAKPSGPIGISGFFYGQGDLAGIGKHADPPKVTAGHSLTFVNEDASPEVDTYHTITACHAPCNRQTGIAYPIANGATQFDSGQLGYDHTGFNAPAIGTDTWQTPDNLKAGTYTYFCRVHPFMRGSFRVVKPKT